MTIDDRYRARLQTVIASLRYWAPEVADVSTVREADSVDYWRLAITPHMTTQCPFELVLRTDGHHDIRIADETYEDMPTVDLELFLPLAEAIAGGRVIQRIFKTTATETQIAIETIVTLASGQTWQRRRQLAEGPPRALLMPDDGLVVADRHFLPYHLSIESASLQGA